MLNQLSTKKRGGFTLVEIMIVVAIIALLAAIAVPSFLRARERSQASTVLNNLRLLEAAKDQWSLETNQLQNTAARLAYVDDNDNPQGVAYYLKENTTLRDAAETAGDANEFNDPRFTTLVYTLNNVGDRIEVNNVFDTEVVPDAFFEDAGFDITP